MAKSQKENSLNNGETQRKGNRYLNPASWIDITIAHPGARLEGLLEPAARSVQ